MLCVIWPDTGKSGSHISLFELQKFRSKIQIMSEKQKRSTSGNFVICDVQEEYAEHLFRILAERFEGMYQFHLFYNVQKTLDFIENSCAEILLIGEECGEDIIRKAKAGKKFILTGNPGKKNLPEGRALFRYQSAEDIVKVLRQETGKRKKGVYMARDEPVVRGLIGVYSPIHRIGKTKFALRLGQKMAAKIPVLYLNMEGYSGGDHYFPGGAGQDLGDLLYDFRQDTDDCGLKLSAMAGQAGRLDYILPMRNEWDVRSVRKKEWTGLLDMIFEKCIYEAVILDLGDAVDGLYDILRKCARIYTPYICEGAALAKLKQYEENLREAGYEDILKRTVRRQAGKTRQLEKSGYGNDKDRTAV